MPAAQLGFGVVSYRAMANRPALRTQRGVSAQRATFQNPLILRQVRGFLARATEKEFKAEEASGSDDEASVQKETVRKTTEAEIAAMVAERRAAKAEATKQPNLVTGAIEEAQLIIWPGIGEALINTFVVIAMVTITSAALFGVNTGLASLSTWLYSGNGSKQALAPASEAKPEIVKATSAAAPSLAPPSLAEGRGNVPSTL